MTQSICTVADWPRPLIAKAHMEVSFCHAHQPIFFKFVEPGCFSIYYCILSTFHVLKFDNGAKSYLGRWSSDVILRLSTFNLFVLSILLGVRSDPKYLGGWSSDVLLRLFTFNLFILLILFRGRTLNTLVDGPVMYSFSRTSSSSRP